MIKVKNLKKKYIAENGDEVFAVNDTTLQLPDKGLVFILGASGSGKTTLLNVLSGLDCADEGQIVIKDEVITDYAQSQLDEFRRKNIGIVFQDSNMITDINVFENIALPLKLLGVEKEEIKKRVEEVLGLVGLEDFQFRNTNELSGGQRQRVAIARGIVKKPEIMFLDEPTGNLDEKNSTEIFELLHKISKSCLVVLVSHDTINAKKYADRIINIKDGKVSSEKENKKMLSKIRSFSIKDTEGNFYGEYENSDNHLILDILYQILMERDMDKEKENVELNLDIHVSCKEFEELEKTKKEQEMKYNDEANGLGFKDKIMFALSNNKKRKVRLFFTFVLFVFTMLYALLMFTMITYDYKDSMFRYLKNKDLQELSLYSQKYYKNIFDEEEEVTSTSGKIFITKLFSFENKENIIKIIYFDEIMDEGKENYSYDVPVRLYSSYEKCKYKIIGDYPRETNEIVLTDYLANVLFPNFKEAKSILGKKIIYSDNTYLVTGIIATDYKKNIDKVSEDDLFTEYAFCLQNINTIENEKNNNTYVKLKSCDFTEVHALDNYLSSNMKYAAIKSDYEKCLISGCMPKNKNEVVISKYVANKIDFDYSKADYDSLSEYQLINLQDKKYNNAFDCINLYSYFPNGIKVVGVFNNQDNDEIMDAEVLVDGEIYRLLKEEYYQYYCFDEIKLLVDKVDMDLIKNIDKSNLKIMDEGCESIYFFVSFINEIKKILYILFFISLLIFIFFLVSYISYAIKDQSKKIGIMRSLGIPKKDIKSIFFINVIMLSLFSMFASSLLFAFVVREINKVYLNYMGKMKFSIITINPFIIMIVVGVILCLSLLCAFVPIQSMAKKSPIDLLKNK